MNVFDCAIKIEEEAQQYYQRLSSVSSSPEKRHLFSMLAASEEEFRDNLIKLKGSLAPEQAESELLNGSACQFRPLLTVGEAMDQFGSDSDLYTLSVREEEEEIRFYEELAEKSSDPATRNCLLMLADEERRHLNMVENIYDFVEAPRSFLAWGEFSNLHEL
jgi:rubrerythrin